jgi:U32 family peptidase
MNKPELLLPAGNIEKMQYALHYGADAVYLGTRDFSLRNMKQGDTITQDNLPEAIKICKELNKKIYVTVNIYAHNNDIEQLPEFLEYLQDLKPDAIIFSDIGVGSLIKKYAPGIDLHLSTQANTTNYVSAQAWRDFGVSRIILARELSLSELQQIKEKVPHLELEVFIHGSLCISYSGRCILSDYMTGNERKSNQGGCAQPCRWKYHLVEETRPGQYFEITEDQHGTYIINSRNLCLAEYIKNLMEINIDSFKVEGRTKSMYYVAVVSRAYREIIDKILNNENINVNSYIEELRTAGNRGFTTNFLTQKPSKTDYDYSTSKGKAGLTFAGTSISDKIINGKLLIRAKNQIKAGAQVEWITPTKTYPDRISIIENPEGEMLEVANTNDVVFLNVPENIDHCRWTILRSKS